MGKASIYVRNGTLVQLGIDKFGMNAMEITNVSLFVIQDAAKMLRRIGTL
jgi:hypothetical protein